VEGTRFGEAVILSPGQLRPRQSHRVGHRLPHRSARPSRQCRSAVGH